uniref:Uncharacterized protein n=1 Tax=Anguilla anguilla TaxID=7936 RepID=A0A0E9UWD9_ANGAN
MFRHKCLKSTQIEICCGLVTL